ncbi:MAG: M23 family metallopeptidase, partial [Candidatus Zixiibacteriota bacterium]
IRTNYEGYGKALYVRGIDDRIYVFAHLNQFVSVVDEILKKSQIEAQRYYVDIYLTPDSVKIQKGKLLAQSGETGAGPPHLHFEARSSDNQPINPLSHGFDLADQTRPVFERIGFQAIDDTSLFDVGLRKVFYKVKKGNSTGEYILDTTLYFNSPFGVLADCHDLTRPDGMRSTVRKLTLYIDDNPYYESIYDTLDYNTDQSSYFEYDINEVMEDHSKVRRLYGEDGNMFRGSRSKSGFRGYIGENVNEKLGRRSGKVVAEDCCGNQSTLTFEFFWGPAGNFFHLDSTVKVDRDTTRFYFSAIKEFKEFGIDSVATFINKGDKWGPPDFVKTLYTPDGKIVSTVVIASLRPVLLRLYIFAGKEGIIRDNVFNGILEGLPKPPGPAAISSDEDGLWITIGSINRGASRAWVKLYNGDKLLGVREARMFNMKSYRCLIPPKEEY